ncbi:tripartite tricarboxylate transporter substrate binding protein [Brevibacterium daeguense]|nr:tripartite tricarboxylate transporter substrate-binding protein [Brevibacterium daeguense]
MISRFTVGTAAVASLALALTGCGDSGGGSASGGGNYPSKPINVNAPAEPGSGWDTTARAMVQVLEEEGIVDVPLPVQNKPGGTGCSWLTEMINNHQGKDDQIAISSLANQTMNERGLCEYGPDDATMIATLFVENFIVVGAEGGDITDLDGLIQSLKDDPAAVPVAAAGDDRLPFALLADAAGIDPQEVNFVDYEGGGEQTTALLNGDAKVAIAGLSEFRATLEAGDLTPIVSFAPEPLEAPFEQVPTAVDSGYDVTLGNWRGVYGPADMPEEAVTYWEETLQTMVESDAWQETVEKNQWTPEFLVGEEMAAYITEANETVREGVEKTEIGS